MISVCCKVGQILTLLCWNKGVFCTVWGWFTGHFYSQCFTAMFFYYFYSLFLFFETLSICSLAAYNPTTDSVKLLCCWFLTADLKLFTVRFFFLLLFDRTGALDGDFRGWWSALTNVHVLVNRWYSSCWHKRFITRFCTERTCDGDQWIWREHEQTSQRRVRNQGK